MSARLISPLGALLIVSVCLIGWESVYCQQWLARQKPRSIFNSIPVDRYHFHFAAIKWSQQMFPSEPRCVLVATHPLSGTSHLNGCHVWNPCRYDEGRLGQRVHQCSRLRHDPKCSLCSPRLFLCVCACVFLVPSTGGTDKPGKENCGGVKDLLLPPPPCRPPLLQEVQVSRSCGGSGAHMEPRPNMIHVISSLVY